MALAISPACAVTSVTHVVVMAFATILTRTAV